MDKRRQKVRRLIIAALFLALPVTLNYYSPYLMTQGTMERVATFSLVLWLAVFATSLVLGRAFCGWACPFNGLQMLWETVRVRSLRPVRFLPVLKYAMWTMWVGGVAALAVSTGGWATFDPLYLTESGVSVTDAGNLITYFMLVGLTLAPSALGRRGFCRYLCPFGIWGIVGERIGAAARVPRLRLVAESDLCSGCRSCEKNCPMQLPVTEMVRAQATRATECFMCATCADSCPNSAVRLGFGEPGPLHKGA